MNFTKEERLYIVPMVRNIDVVIERGFAESEADEFEQPEYGGEDNI